LRGVERLLRAPKPYDSLKEKIPGTKKAPDQCRNPWLVNKHEISL
jgi:hypothetical protein